MDRLSIVIADDHPVFRSGLEAAIQADPRFELVGSAQDGVEALALVQQHEPDLLLLDMSMPRKDGLEVAREIIHAAYKTRVLPLSGHTDSEYVLGALNAGVRGYLLKDEKPSTIVNALIHVSKGGVFVSEQLLVGSDMLSLQTKLTEKTDPKSRLDQLGFTPRLQEVLMEVAQGLTNEEIGDRLFKSPHTVRNQVETLKSIAGVQSRPALVAWAWRNGFAFPTAGSGW